jgi:hypothetical protein
MSLRFRSCFTAVLLAAIVSAKAGMASDVPTLDPHFGGADGIARVGFDVVANGSDMAEAALLADGKLLLAGTAQTGTGQYDLAFARLDAVSGAPDPGFGGGTGRVLAGLAPIQTFARVDLARDADGRILFVAGTLNSATAIVGRLSGDGTPDLAFNGTGRRFFNGGFFVDGGTQMQLARAAAGGRQADRPRRRGIRRGQPRLHGRGAVVGERRHRHRLRRRTRQRLPRPRAVDRRGHGLRDGRTRARRRPSPARRHGHAFGRFGLRHERGAPVAGRPVR